jgi:hypothetical protein
MLHALGVGGKRGLPSAAALNWVLKDGLGRLGRLIYAAGLGRTFDCNLKVRDSFSWALFMHIPFSSYLLSLCFSSGISPYIPNLLSLSSCLFFFQGPTTVMSIFTGLLLLGSRECVFQHQCCSV